MVGSSRATIIFQFVAKNRSERHYGDRNLRLASVVPELLVSGFWTAGAEGSPPRNLSASTESKAVTTSGGVAIFIYTVRPLPVLIDFKPCITPSASVGMGILRDRAVLTLVPT